jgi:hypothetical protein
MSAANVTFAGAKNSADTTLDEQRALMLKVFAGEVITQFEESSLVLDKHTVRTISNGKSASFPVIGNMPDAEYHTPGEEILGQEVPKSERIIPIDRLLISHVFIDDLDDAMLHYDIRSKYSRMMGQKLSMTFDRNVMRNIILAARESAAVVTGGAKGERIKNANLASGTEADFMAAWVDSIYTAAQKLDEKYVTGPRYCLLKPADYYNLIKAVSSNGFSVIHRDYGGEGSFADGKVLKIAGIDMIPAPTLPVDNSSTDTFHGVDARTTKAIVFTPDAVGTVKLLDLSLQTQWDIRRQGTLMVAR